MKEFCIEKQSGLSLLELIIALALTGMIAVISYPSLAVIIKSWNSIEFTTTPNDQFAAQRFIRHQIERASLIFEKERSTRENLLSFQGSISRLSFVSPMDRIADLPGLYVTSFEIEQKQEKQYITFDYQLYRGSFDGPQSQSVRRTIVEGISDAQISYYSKAKRAWVTSWEDRKSLPQLVSFNFIDHAGLARRWVIALRMATSFVTSAGV